MRLRFLVVLAALAISVPTFAATPASDAPSGALEPLLGALTKDQLFRTTEIGLHVADVRTGQQVFAHRSDAPMSPASTMKILSAATALKHLGPAYRFVTQLAADGPIRSGVLEGNLFVKGSGDPTLVVEKLWKLVYDLKLLGIDRVDGDVIFDETFFTDDYRLVGWDKERDLERGPSYFPSLSALSLNYNTVALVIGPGDAGGHPASVTLETPAQDYVQVVSEATTGASASRRWLEIHREVIDHRMRYTVRGSVPVDAQSQWYYRTVADPTSHFAAAWAAMMKVHGVQVAGRYRRGDIPADAKQIHELRSPPLTAILADMNKYSNNFVAEQVLRAVGAEVLGPPGTNDKGLEVVAAYLTELRVDAADYRLVNGSGLSREARLTPRLLTRVLNDMAQDPQVGQEFLSSLAIAGLDGTLWRRLTEDPGRLRGKTGTIEGVHCLAGFVDSEDGKRYAFAFMVNGLAGSSAQAKRLHDRFARKMFTAAPDDGVVVQGDHEQDREPSQLSNSTAGD